MISELGLSAEAPSRVFSSTTWLDRWVYAIKSISDVAQLVWVVFFVIVSW